MIETNAPQDDAGPTAADRRPAPRARSGGRPARLVLGLSFLVLLGAWLWFVRAATRRQRAAELSRAVLLLTVDRPMPPGGRFPGDPYIGSRACAGCHPGEAALHSRSGHASTLRPASRRALARRLGGRSVADPERPDVTWRYRLDDGRLRLDREAPEAVERFILEYAFGSGRNATTFVTLADPRAPEAFEHRLTAYARGGRLGISPGQDAADRLPGTTPSGRRLSPRETRKCFRCHATQTSARGNEELDVPMLIPDVSCERCHGPGRAHAAAARRGASDSELGMPFGAEGWTADGLLLMCGECHRHPSRARPEQIRPDDPHLARFQPIGLMQSRCYAEGRGALHCVTCHDPHARASADLAAYVAACLRCHAPAGPARQAETDAPAARRSCPVSPRADCIRCHMPRVDSGQNVPFTDHWIRVRRDEEAPRAPSPAPGHEVFDRDDL